MQTFTILGNQWFDQTREPVLLLGDQGLSYYNDAAAELFCVVGVPLEEGGQLPQALAHLDTGADAAGEVELDHRRFVVSVQKLEAGRLFQLRPIHEQAVFPNDRLPELAYRLRAPLSTLLSAVELLTQRLPERDAKVDRYEAVVNQSYCRLLRLVDHLERARFLTGEEAEDFCPVVLDLAGLFREVGRNVDSVGACNGHTFGWTDNAGSLLVKGDGDLLFHMMYQLIANAWRSGGDVTMQLDRRGGRAVITVSDNGRGMSSEALRDAFDPSAGRDGLAGAEDGLGLGIPICQHIAALHGGTMVLENRPEQGVSAIVSLPVCKAAPNMEVRSPRLGQDTTGGFSSVLVELSEVLPMDRFRREDLE